MAQQASKQAKKSYPLIACQQSKPGFTLIELSIVLVVIGLIVGGVLVGRDLIASTQIRSQIKQIEEFNIAANTFKLKYGNLPGDLSNSDALSMSFAARVNLAGNNGVLNQFYSTTGWSTIGEANYFFMDLSQAQMIGGRYLQLDLIDGFVNGEDMIRYLPKGKMGGGTQYLQVWANGPTTEFGNNYDANNGKNYFTFLSRTRLAGANNYDNGSSFPLTPIQANNIDSKIDDGMPQSGKVLAFAPSPVTYLGGRWAGNNSWTERYSGDALPNTGPVSGSSSTCYDNNNIAGPQKYSIASAGNNLNCALSFEFR